MFHCFPPGDCFIVFHQGLLHCFPPGFVALFSHQGFVALFSTRVCCIVFHQGFVAFFPPGVCCIVFHQRFAALFSTSVLLHCFPPGVYCIVFHQGFVALFSTRGLLHCFPPGVCCIIFHQGFVALFSTRGLSHCFPLGVCCIVFLQGFVQNENRARNLADVSVLPDLCNSHRHQLVVMLKNHQSLHDIRRRCMLAKEELSINLHTRLRLVECGQPVYTTALQLILLQRVLDTLSYRFLPVFRTVDTSKGWNNQVCPRAIGGINTCHKMRHSTINTVILNPLYCYFEAWPFLFSPQCHSSLGCINEYLTMTVVENRWKCD